MNLAQVGRSLLRFNRNINFELGFKEVLYSPTRFSSKARAELGHMVQRS